MLTNHTFDLTARLSFFYFYFNKSGDEVKGKNLSTAVTIFILRLFFLFFGPYIAGPKKEQRMKYSMTAVGSSSLFSLLAFILLRFIFLEANNNKDEVDCCSTMNHFSLHQAAVI